jgi:hypothetical protein
MNSRPNLLWLGALLLCSTLTTATSTSPATSNGVSIVQETLTALGSRPFHLKATITERGDPTSKTEVEIFWMAPDKWRRTIKSQTEFNQTLVVNGDKFFEQDSDQYFPLWSQTLVAAMVDPKIVLDAYRPGDRLITKANGGTNESGVVCFPPTFKMCFKGRYGMMETVGAAGHSVDFMDYQEFQGKRVARRLTYRVDAGDSYTAEVTELKDLKNPDSDLFSITEASTQEKRIRSVMLPEAELRGLAQQPLEIIWPQVLDGATSGRTSYYVSVDRSGQVAEVLPLAITAERADGSARRQIMKWNFKPTVQDGIAVQTEGILSFDFNMRAYGPAEPLDDAAARKMASKIVEPILPANAVSGSSHAFSVAVDEAGNVIEIIAGDGPRELSAPCFEAVKQWRFNVMLEGGRPLPYRAQVVCRVP